jgi:hypothetical protein
MSGPFEGLPGGRGIVHSRFVDGEYQPYESLGPHELKQIQQSVSNGWGNIYWVSTSFVDELRPRDQ